MGDVTDWQPHMPGDPTYSTLEHILTLNSNDSHIAPDVCKQRGPGKELQLGIFMPDARMEKLAATKEMAAAYSLRMANVDVEWVALKGEGAVNVVGNVMCSSSGSGNSGGGE